MAKTPRASKASDATTSGTTGSPKKAAKKKAAADAGSPAQASEPASKKAAKKKAAADAPKGKKAAKKSAAEAPASKKAAKKSAAAAPASKKAAKKSAKDQASADAPKAKKASKKSAAADAPAPKKAGKKSAKGQASADAPKKASKKKAAKAEAAQQSEQLALSMDIDPPAATDAAAPAKPLQPGDRAPDFSLESDDGQTYSRQSLAGTRFVLYFYPKDDTPGCTREACDFRDHRPQLDAAGVKVLGVSSDSLKSHGKFRSKYSLDFPLLSDPDRAVAQAFGVVGVKKLYGKTNIGVIRSTFVVGPDGTIEKTFSPVKVDGHAEAVLQALA